MNAYEIADELQKHGLNGDNHGLFNKRIQNMLRQQADRIVLLEAYLKSEENRIADLEKQLEHYKNKAEALDKKELELLAEIRSLEKDLHMIQRHYDQLDTQLHPQTKPLSDDEIDYLVDKCSDFTDDNDSLEFRYNDFARAIEERHGIK